SGSLAIRPSKNGRWEAGADRTGNGTLDFSSVVRLPTAFSLRAAIKRGTSARPRLVRQPAGRVPQSAAPGERPRVTPTGFRWPKSALVPRTRSSRISCREFDRELRVQRGTRIIELLVVLDSEVRKRGCRTNDANFG